MNGYKIVLLKAILCFIGCRKVNGYAPEYVITNTTSNSGKEKAAKDLLFRSRLFRFNNF